MADITVQTANVLTALNHTYASVASGDTVANDGNTLLLFKNTNASARTLTVPANAVDRAGLGTISSAALTVSYTIPGSATNGGECMVPFMPTDRFNNNQGKMTLNFDNVTGLTVAAVKMRRPA